MSEKQPKSAPKSRKCAPTPQNQARAVSWATWLKIQFPGHLVHPQNPTFCGFHTSELPEQTPRKQYQGSLGTARGQPGPRTAGANCGSTRVPWAEEKIFSKVVPRTLGMLIHVFIARFKTVGARSRPWKIPKCLGNGPLRDQKRVKNGSKPCFSSDPRPLGMLNKVFVAHFAPVVTPMGT